MTTIQSHRISSILPGIDRAPTASASGFDEALRPYGWSGATTICPREESVVLRRPQEMCGGLPGGGTDDCAGMKSGLPSEGTCAVPGGPSDQECATVSEIASLVTCEPHEGQVRAGPQVNAFRVESLTTPVMWKLEISLAAYDLAARLPGEPEAA